MRSPTDRPNIILINCDDLGYGDVGCYGSTLHATPHLDRMAAEGLRCTDFYMASPVCSPSRGALMTGCYPPRIGLGCGGDGRAVLFPGDKAGLHPDEVTIARLLQEQGYATQLVGKWHLGDQPEFLPTRHGFDHYYGLPYSNDMGRQAGREDRWPPLPLLRDEEVIQAQPDQTGLTERYVEEGVRFLRAHQDQPFFLYFAHMHVHLPLYAAPRFIDQSRNGPYGACVEAIDWSVGVLFDELQRLGLDDNTMVLFTSDNGSRTHEGGSNDPLRGMKGTTWEGGMRLPLIARWPGQIPAGSTCSELTTSMDLLPTLARLAGTTEPQDRLIDGRDITPLLQAKEGATSPHEVFFYYWQNTLQAIRNERWKLHVRRGRDAEEVSELYDLHKDVGETTNLFEQQPEIVAELQAHATRARTDLGCEASAVVGSGCRPRGHVEDPQTLTTYDPEHPYIIALYDLTEAG
ncbi:MAG: Cerebroside-sulfatase [Gemmatimonadaceae bacterium]|nr:Cerebroside-sulfatase [Gemmatimonadaceae bacterium]